MTEKPDMPETLYSLGKAASLSGDAQTAEKVWTRVIELEKETSLASAGAFRTGGSLSEARQGPANATRNARVSASSEHDWASPFLNRFRHEAISYNSYRNRHCPQAPDPSARPNAPALLAAREGELLATSYFHVVHGAA